MVTLKKYNLSGKEHGEITPSTDLVDAKANSQSVKDYIIALRENQRQWSASVKRRSEVSHSTKKPHPQKGTGRARQGSLASTQYKGGGRPMGPKPKFDQHVKINKKEKRAAIRALLGEKIREGKVIIIDNFKVDEPSTKKVAHFLDKVGLNRRVLFLGESALIELEDEFGEKFFLHAPQESHHAFKLSVRNIPCANFVIASTISGYDILSAHHLVVSEKALEELTAWLVGA
jgi:large subunit ribosomal protein L4